MDHENFRNSRIQHPGTMQLDSEVSDSEGISSDEGRGEAGVWSEEVFTLQSPPQVTHVQRADRLFGRAQPGSTFRRA
jgi:hypothetical protein